jgi:hypothetical protein
MEVANSSKRLAPNYQITRRLIPEDRNFSFRRR